MLSAGRSGNIQTNNHRREVGPDQAVAVGPSEVVVLKRLAERLAPRIADELRSRLVAPELVDATEAARILGLSRGAVYRKARQLGGMRVGTNPNAPWRFDRAQLLAAMDVCSTGRSAPEGSQEADRPSQRRSRRRAQRREPTVTASGFPLLPVRGLE